MKVKKWLEDNEIYFRTIATALLSGMAIIISISQIRVDRTQNQILLEQRDIAAKAILPQFVVSVRQLQNEATKQYEDNVLLIYNEGNAILSVEVSELSILDIGVQEVDGDNVSSEVLLYDYFYLFERTGEREGLMYVISTDGNNAWFGETYRDFIELDKPGFGSIGITTILKINYQTTTGSQEEDFFIVKGLTGSGRLLSREEGSTLFDKYANDALLEKHSFLDLDASDLLRIATQSK